MWQDLKFNSILNKKIASIELNNDKTQVQFKFQDGTIKTFQVVGDCCSYSWIEHLELPEDVNGSTILDVKELYVGANKEDPRYDENYDYSNERIQTYQTVPIVV